MKRIKKVLLVVGIIILVGVAINTIEMYKEEVVIEGNHKNMISIMLEQNAGAGDYVLENRTNWPTKDDGYVINLSLSKCENWSKLSWDEESNTVVMASITSDKCYVYFDKVLTLVN